MYKKDYSDMVFFWAEMTFCRYQNIPLMFSILAPVTRGPLNVCVGFVILSEPVPVIDVEK